MIYPCRQCDFKATNKDNLTKHQSEHLEEDHLFQECCQQFTHEGSLIGHKNSIHESIGHHCEQCDYKATITIHWMSRHPNMIFPHEQHLIKHFGSPAEPAWGPSPKLF